jgi:hypothetical protein
LLREDLMTTATAMATLVGAGIVSTAEARAYMDLPTAQGDPLAVVSVATPPDQGTGATPPVAEGGPAQP